MTESRIKPYEVELAHAYLKACLSELEAIKPGNVHMLADGHGMTVQDFIDSAEASAPWITQKNIPLGQRIVDAVQATFAKVACNTNLGIVLLCAPIIQAKLNQHHQPTDDLQTHLNTVLANTTVEDATKAFEAICIAKPAGLAVHERHDVRLAAKITLWQAMDEAKAYDTIGKQYSEGYREIFEQALPFYKALITRWERQAWATTGLYLFWLSKHADSHIARKWGLALANRVQSEAQQHLEAFTALENPKNYMPQLLSWDKALKLDNINPGTSADLTVASILIDNINS